MDFVARHVSKTRMLGGGTFLRQLSKKRRELTLLVPTTCTTRTTPRLPTASPSCPLLWTCTTPTTKERKTDLRETSCLSPPLPEFPPRSEKQKRNSRRFCPVNF